MKKSLFYALVAASLFGTAAHADSLTLTLNPSAVSAAPGTTATYTATISAPNTNGSPVYLNGDSITFAGPQDIVLDDSGLFLNFDAFLSPGQSETAALFTVMIPASEPTGSYSGFYVLQGGSDGNVQDTLATQPFTLNVASAAPTAVTPEPASYLLVATGMLGSLVLLQRKRAASAL